MQLIFHPTRRSSVNLKASNSDVSWWWRVHREASMKNNRKTKAKPAAQKNQRTYSDLMNDSKTRGVERIIEASAIISEQAASEEISADPLSRENLIAAGTIAPKFSVETISSFSRDLIAIIKSLKLAPVSIHSISENIYRIDGFGSRHQTGDLQNLARQLKYDDPTQDDAALINPPLVYENESKTIACVSGWKRVKAARENGLPTISCRLLKYADIHNIFAKHGLENLKNEALKAAFTHIVYSESEHNSPLNDISILNYFHEIKENHLFERKDFHEVLQLIGCSRKSPRYNDLYRLWKIACQPDAYTLVKEKKVKIRLFKNHTNIDIMYHRPSKALQVRKKIEEYINRIRPIADKDLASADPIELDTYEDAEIQKIIFEIDQPHLSKDEIDGRKYRSPRKNVRVDGSKIEIQSFRINFDDKSDNNVRNIIETLYVLESVVKDLRDYAASIGAQEPEPLEKPIPPSHKGTHIVHGEKYYDFIRKNNLWDFCDVVAMSSYIQKKGDFSVTAEEMKKINKLPSAERAKTLIQEFRRYGAVRNAKDIEREHAEANATDKEIKKNRAPTLPPLSPLPDDVLWESKKNKTRK